MSGIHKKASVPHSIKILVVGDPGCGKTTLYLRHLTGKYTYEDVPNVLDDHTISVDRNLNLRLWDTPGSSSFDRIRPLAYPGTNVFLLCFDITSRASFDNIKSWYNELKSHCSHTPIILVATKTDLRRECSTSVSSSDVQAAAKRLDCFHVETSSLNGEGVGGLFDLIKQVGLEELNLKLENSIKNPVTLGTPSYRNQCTIVSIGFDCAGKTSMLMTYYVGIFPKDYTCSIFDNVCVTDNVYGNTELLDTSGNENYEHLRPLSYTNANVFLLCFAVNNRQQFGQLEEYWFYEAQHFRPDVPIILTATKIDLREAEENCVTTEEGEALAAKTGSHYAEISSLKGVGLEELFTHAKELGHKHNLSLKVKQH